MRDSDLFMTRRAQAMVRATVMRNRLLCAALHAVLILEWDRIPRPIAPRAPILEWPRCCPQWDSLFFPRDGFAPPRHHSWLVAHFGAFPDFLVHQALFHVEADLYLSDPAQIARVREALKRMTLAEFVAARSPPLHIFFSSDNPAAGMVEQVRYDVIRMRLFDEASGTWQWQHGMFPCMWRRRSWPFGWRKPLPVFSAPLREGGARMVAVPEACAKLVIGHGMRIEMKNVDRLDTASVLDILPFDDLTVPESYLSGEPAVAVG